MSAAPHDGRDGCPIQPAIANEGQLMTEAEFHRALGELERRLGGQLTLVASEIAAVNAGIKYVEGQMSSLEAITVKQAEMESELRHLTVWKAKFEGEKAERDKNADNVAAVWRRIAAGLVIALVIALVGAGMGMYVQYEQGAAIQHQLMLMQTGQLTHP